MRFLMGMAAKFGELEVEITNEKDVIIRLGDSECIGMSLEDFRQVVFWVDFIEEHKLGAK
jgi:hypothetical protein